jgi:hypothetical protein
MNLRIIILTLFLSSNIRGQNNLIHNHSFETNIASEPNAPCKISQLENLQVWEDDHQTQFNDPVNFCDYLKCSNDDCFKCEWLHSPDWFKADNGVTNPNNNTHAVVIYSVPANNPFGLEFKMIKARTGEGYCGMLPGELIEQKFFNSSPIVGGKRYTFSMYVQIAPFYSKLKSVNPTDFSSHGFVNDQNSVFTLNVYLGKNKIKYHQEAIVCNSPFETTINNDFKDFTTNSIVNLKSFQIPIINFSPLQWHRLTFEFVCPSNHNWDYIAIEEALGSEGNNAYLLIDDVSLVQTCELSCYPTSGIPNPVIGMPTAYTIPLQISNLNNVEKARLEIFPVNGANAIYDATYHWTNGITQNIYWNGIGVAAATYVSKLTCDNECGQFIFTNQVVHFGSAAPYPPNTPGSKIEERQIYSCCLLDYTISNATMTNSHYYKPRNNIYVINNVNFSNGSNTSLVAGEQIQMTGEISTQSTAELSVYIEDCPDSHKVGNPESSVLTDKDFTFIGGQYSESKDSINQTNLQVGDHFVIFPNPNNGNFFVNFGTEYELPKSIIIEDVLGSRILKMDNPDKYSLEFDMKNYAEGVYTIKALYKTSWVTKKIVKM